MREYELTIVIQPEISEEGSQAILAGLDEILADGDSIRLLCDDLGKRKLAYEIRKFHKGHYHLLSFLDEGSVIPALERVLRLEESVLRFLTVKSSDQVIDIEARKLWAKEREIELKKRAEERAVREAEEAKARAEAEAERLAAEQAAAERAAAEKAAAEKAAAAEAADSTAAEQASEGEGAVDASDDEASAPSPPAEESKPEDASPADDEASADDKGDEAEKETS